MRKTIIELQKLKVGEIGDLILEILLLRLFFSR